MNTLKSGPYPDVRALGRGLAVIEHLAQVGWAKPGEIARETGIDRGTVYRLVHTLNYLDYVVKREEDGAFSLTRKLRDIASAVRVDELLTPKIAPHLVRLTETILWPSDCALYAGGAVTIQESTHRLSPMTFQRFTIGQERSLLDSALGLAILMELEPAELDAALQIEASASSGTISVRDIEVARVRVEELRRLGYAWAAGAVDPRVSAIALGFRGRDRIVGSVNIVFFKRALSPAAAAEAFLPQLRQCVDQIAKAF